LEVDVHLAVSIAHAELGLCAQVYGADVPPTGSVKDARRLRITIEREDVLRRWIEQDAVGILGGPGFPQHGEGLEVNITTELSRPEVAKPWPDAKSNATPCAPSMPVTSPSAFPLSGSTTIARSCRAMNRRWLTVSSAR